MVAGSPGGKEVGRLNLKVLPDTSAFGRSLERYIQRIERQLVVELPVQINQASVTKELAELEARLDAAPINVNIDADLEAKEVKAHMVALLAELQAIARALRPRITPDVDVGGAAAKMTLFSGALKLADSGASQVGRKIALWGPLILVAGVALAGIAPALLVVFPLVAGLAAGVAAIALGWKQIKKTMQPVIDGFKKMREGIGKTLTAGLKPLLETFVKKFMPVIAVGLKAFSELLNGAAKSFLKFLNSATGLGLVKQLMAGLAVAMKPFAALAAPLTELFLRLSIAALPALQLMGDAILDITKRLNKFLASGGATDAITESMSDLGAILVEIGQFGKDLFPAMFAAVPGIIAFLDGFGEALGAVFRALVPVFTFMSEHKNLMVVVGAAIAGVAIAFVAVTAALAIFGALTSSIFVAIAVAIGGIVAAVVVAYNRFDAFRAFIDTTWSIIKVIFKVAVAAIKAYLTPLIATVKFIIGLFTDFKGTISRTLDSVAAKFKGLKGKITAVLAGARDWLVDAGKNIVRGLIDGAGSLLSRIGEFFLDKVPGWIKGAFKKALGIHSPSTVFAGYGVNIVQGLIDGIDGMQRELVKTVAGIEDAVSISPTVGVDYAGVTGNVRAAAAFTPLGATTSGAPANPVELNVYPQPGQSETDIGNAAANRILWVVGR